MSKVLDLGPLGKSVELKEPGSEGVEPYDVDCNTNKVHAQSQFHLQGKSKYEERAEGSGE